jgi:hypothetical protein
MIIALTRNIAHIKKYSAHGHWFQIDRVSPFGLKRKYHAKTSYLPVPLWIQAA